MGSDFGESLAVHARGCCPCVATSPWLGSGLVNRVRAFDPDHVVVLVQWGEARECADPSVRELWGADGRYAAAQRENRIKPRSRQRASCSLQTSSLLPIARSLEVY